MEKFGVELEMIDKLTGPAKKMTGALEGITKETDKVTKATAKAEAKLAAMKANPGEFKRLARVQREVREEAEKLSKKGLFSWANPYGWGRVLAETVGELGAQVVDKLLEVPAIVADIGAEMVKSAAAAERFQVSFEGLLGKDEGDETLEYIERISKATEGTDDELKGLAARLLTVGFDAKELSQVLPASLDIAGFLGGGVEKAEAAAEALAHIKTTGEISKRSLGALGLQWTQVMKELQKETGLGEEGVKAKLESGTFGPQALHAVLQSIANKEGGQLGTQAEKMAGTVYAKLKKLQDVPDQIFQKWAKSPGFDLFSKSLDKILNKLDPDGPNGQKIFAALDRASLMVVRLVDKFADGDGVDRFSAGVAKVIDQVEKFPAILDKIITVSEVLGTAWAGSKIVGAVTTLTAAFPALGTAAGATMGIITGAAAPFLAVAAAAGAVGVAIYEAIKAYQDWHRLKVYTDDAPPAIANNTVNENSPQWKKDRYGAQPMIASQSTRVQQGGARQSVNIGGIHITAPTGDADEISEAVNQSLPGAMQQGFERMSVASGVL